MYTSKKDTSAEGSGANLTQRSREKGTSAKWLLGSGANFWKPAARATPFKKQYCNLSPECSFRKFEVRFMNVS